MNVYWVQQYNITCEKATHKHEQKINLRITYSSHGTYEHKLHFQSKTCGSNMPESH